MKRNEPALENFIRDYVDSKDDFIAIHWRDTFTGQESLVRYKLQNRKLPKTKGWDEVKERYFHYWPGLSPKKCVKLIKTYGSSACYGSSFYCVYRTNNVDGLEDQIKDLIPEENRERV